MSTATSARAPTDEGSLVRLGQVSWQTYCELRDAWENRHVRMTFDQGRLYLMSPSRLHERIAELIGQLVIAWTDVHHIPRLSAGSTTMKAKLLNRGLEPDKCYYIQNEAAVQERSRLYPAATRCAKVSGQSVAGIRV